MRPHNHGAFVIGPERLLEGRPAARLSGLTFAVKDLFDVCGLPTGAGNPTWRREHLRSETTAPVVSTLVEAGADLIGKTHTDEFAFGLSGQNHHYGTPQNPRAPDRIPGGSSSGSAVAVAAGAVEFALGTDTGGSVRVPAGYCGVLGFRPTHGRIPTDGIVPLAPSFDTVGVFAASSEVLENVVDVLVGDGGSVEIPDRLLVVTEAFQRAEPAVTEALLASMRQAATVIGVDVDEAPLTPEDSLAEWLHLFRIRQLHEAWSSHGTWIQAQAPSMGPGVSERFASAAQVTDHELRTTEDARRQARATILEALERTVLVVPSAPDVAPPLTPVGRGAAVRRRTMEITCIAGLAGAPALSLPIAEVRGLPVGLCLVGPPGSDGALVALGTRISAAASAVSP